MAAEDDSLVQRLDSKSQQYFEPPYAHTKCLRIPSTAKRHQPLCQSV